LASVSYLDDEARFLREYAEFHQRVRAVLVVVGGKALNEKRAANALRLLL
jgi:hypothetical protein